jgi:hypothetical protein
LSFLNSDICEREAKYTRSPPWRGYGDHDFGAFDLFGASLAPSSGRHDHEYHAIWNEAAKLWNVERDDDPHGEHDFGAFEFFEQKLFWKIDYYHPDRHPRARTVQHRVVPARSYRHARGGILTWSRILSGHIIDVWDIETFDTALLSDLRDHGDLIANYIQTDREISDEYEKSDHTRMRCPNPFVNDFIHYRDHRLLTLLECRTIRAWHYSRMTDAEVSRLRAVGILPNNLTPFGPGSTLWS